ncbi:MAG: aldose epimerase family protein, partial [Candidatus Bathyarchaeia archaeon]
MGVSKRPFGRLPDGRGVDLYTLSAGDVEVDATNYGCIITSIRVPDSAGGVGDVVHGFETLDGYLGKHPYFGAVVGRYANRIAGARFGLDGAEYRLARNDGENSLHGGLRGFDKVLWDAEARGDALRLSYLSRDGEEGYPGNLKAAVTYALGKNGDLSIDYEATTDRATVVNLTNHTYFNLSGGGDILRHELTLDAEQFTPSGKGLIPTGEVRSVAGTPMDFRHPKRIGERIDNRYEQLALGGGYDCNWVVDGEAGRLRRAATVRDPGSGRAMVVLTTQPGVQFYTGNFLDGTLR